MDLSYTSNSGEKRLRSGTGPGRIHYRICRNGISLYQARHDVPVKRDWLRARTCPGRTITTGRNGFSLARSLALPRSTRSKKRGRGKEISAAVWGGGFGILEKRAKKLFYNCKC
jgi:hypothetical protein